MKWLALLKQFPKYALVLGVLVGSTVLFGLWWLTHSREKLHPARDTATEQAAIRRKAAQAEARIDYLFLADADLYDAGTGELVFKNWLKGDAPLRLYYEPKSKKLLGQFDRGFARYAFDGTREATMMMAANPPAFFDGFKKAVFVKNKDVWVADVDWQGFKFVNERRVTSIESFYENHFAENILLLTAKTLVVRNLNNLLRVNLEDGNVKPVRLPLGDIGKRRSPDSKWVVGFLKGQLYCYDVDADEAKTISVGRNALVDFQWLGNDKCLGLVGREGIVAYDRAANKLAEVAALPFPCFKMGEPSPNGRFIFAVGGLGGSLGALVDVEKKTAVQVNGGTGIIWISNDTFTLSREVADSNLRGTWVRKAGEGEMRASPEPYLVGNGGSLLLTLPSAGLIVLATRHGLMTMKSDGTAFTTLQSQAQIPARLMRVERWPVE